MEKDGLEPAIFAWNAKKVFTMKIMPTRNVTGTIVQPVKETKGNVLITWQTKNLHTIVAAANASFMVLPV